MKSFIFALCALLLAGSVLAGQVDKETEDKIRNSLRVLLPGLSITRTVIESKARFFRRSLASSCREKNLSRLDQAGESVYSSSLPLLITAAWQWRSSGGGSIERTSARSC